MIRFTNSHRLVCSTLIVAAAATPLARGQVTEPPPYIDLLGVIRDFPPGSQHPDFTVAPPATPGGRSAMNVNIMLDADKKPAYVGNGRRVATEFRDSANNKIAWCAPVAPGDSPGTLSGSDDGGVTSAATFAGWFRDLPGINMSRPQVIRLDRNAAGVYIFDAQNFHPIDFLLLGNGVDEHNFYFTYEITASFVAEPGQFVTFTGDDDAWIFIDNRLIIDHGGIAANRRQHFTVDRLGLTPGQVYEWRFFWAERYQPQSQFRLETNIELMSTTSVATFNACD
jgi:fibro-slime domain-containing protein